jgi:hypothetical protein
LLLPLSGFGSSSLCFPPALALRIHSSLLLHRCNSFGSSSPRSSLPDYPSFWASMISALRNSARIPLSAASRF